MAVLTLQRFVASTRRRMSPLCLSWLRMNQGGHTLLTRPPPGGYKDVDMEGAHRRRPNPDGQKCRSSCQRAQVATSPRCHDDVCHGGARTAAPL